MKKIILLTSLIAFLPFTSIATVGCSYIKNKESEIAEEVERVIDVSSVAVRTNIYSNKTDNPKLKNANDLLDKIQDKTMKSLVSGSSNFFSSKDTFENESNYFFNTSTPSITLKSSSNHLESSNKLNDNLLNQKSNVSNSSITDTLNLIIECLGLVNIPLNTSIVTTIQSLINNPAFSAISSFLNPLLYSNTSSALDNNSIDNFSLGFKPLISTNNKTITNEEAMQLAFYNLFHCLNFLLPSTDQSDIFKKPLEYDGKLPNITYEDYQRFATLFFQDLGEKKISFSISKLQPLILQSIFIFINYISRFFDTSNNDIYLMNDSELNIFSKQFPQKNVFEYLFSKTKNNSEITKEIDNEPFKNGINVNSVIYIINNIIKDSTNGESIARIFDILLPHDNNSDEGNTQHYDSIMTFIFDALGAFLTGNKSTSDIGKYWIAIKPIIINIIENLSKNITLNSVIKKISTVLPVLPSNFQKPVQESIKLLKGKKSFYNSKSDKDTPPKNYNQGSISDLWNTDIIKQLITLTTGSDNIDGYKIIGKNLLEIINNFLNEFKINISNVDISLENIVSIIKDILLSFNEKNPFIFNSEDIFNILQAVSLDNSKYSDKYQNLQNNFFKLLKSNFNSNTIIAKETKTSSYEQLMSSDYGKELKNKSILAYFLMECQDNTLGNSDSIDDLLGIEKDSYKKGGYADIVFSTINKYSTFLNFSFLHPLLIITSKLLEDINNSQNNQYNSITDPNSAVIRNKYNSDCKNHFPDNISYDIYFTDKDNHKWYKYHVNLSLIKNPDNYNYGNIVATQMN